MPDQPTASPSTPPGQNLAGPGSPAELLSNHPRWALGEVTDDELEDLAVQEHMRDLLLGLGTIRYGVVRRGFRVSLDNDIGTLTVTGPKPGLTAALVLLAAWTMKDPADAIGGEE